MPKHKVRLNHLRELANGRRALNDYPYIERAEGRLEIHACNDVWYTVWKPTDGPERTEYYGDYEFVKTFNGEHIHTPTEDPDRFLECVFVGD